MAQKNNEQELSTGAKTGLGIAALAAAAAGAYYFYGTKDADKNRKKMKTWMVQMRADVMDKMEKMKDVTQENYDAAISQISDKYSKVKSLNPEEVAAAAADLRKHWNNINRHINPPAKKKAVKAKKVK